MEWFDALPASRRLVRSPESMVMEAVMRKLSGRFGVSPIIGLRIPIELRQQLDELAADQGFERSEFIRRLILAALCSPDMKKPARGANSAGTERSPKGEFHGTNARS
jgi:hypothetical protein